MAADDIDRQTWVFIIGAVVLIYSSFDAFRRGETTFTTMIVRRSEDPGLFWASIVISAVLGVGAALVVCFRFVRWIVHVA